MSGSAVHVRRPRHLVLLSAWDLPVLLLGLGPDEHTALGAQLHAGSRSPKHSGCSASPNPSKPFLEEISQAAWRLFPQAAFRDRETLELQQRRAWGKQAARLNLREVLTRLILETELISCSRLGHLPGSQSPLLSLLNRDSSGCKQVLFPCG